MNKTALIALCLLVSFASHAKPKAKCKKNQTEVSCEKVEGSKRKSFCSNVKVTDAGKEKMCKTKKIKKKNKKAKKVAKKKS